MCRHGLYDMELTYIGEKRTALFAVIPDNDSSFNFLVGMLYTQLFQSLMFLADHKYGGRLPVHVHFVMDEFANVALPDEFEKLLSTMRSREISVSIILQNLAQLKALFEKQWESIIASLARTSKSNTYFFIPNPQSPYRSNKQFVPVWWRDDFDYIIQSVCTDAHTPGGTLTAWLSGNSYSNLKINIEGSMYDDDTVSGGK